jgi:hypothetical protein
MGTAPVPLSQAVIWRDQRQYFVEAGIDAWRRNVVPSYVTNNPFIAHAYAQMLRAYLRDLRDSAALPADGSPVHIVELGAGCGRFAHFLLKDLFAEADHAASLPPIRYIMTDVVRANIEFWRRHERFQPYFDSGQLDVALYDPAQDHVIDLEVAALSLGPGSGPLVVIANYVFDGIPHDVFRVEGGELQEGLVSLAPRDHGVSGPRALGEAELVYEFRPCGADYYGDPICDAILADYRRQLCDSVFSMPVEAFRMVDNLRRLAGDRLLLLAGDKAHTELHQLDGLAPPQPVVHGSISFTVNFHALGTWATRQGGLALPPGRSTPWIAAMGFLFGARPGETIATQAAYDTHIRQFGPSDFFLLRRHMLASIDELGIPGILALMQLARGDIATLQRGYERIAALLPHASRGERHALRQQLLAGWDNYLPLQEKVDVAFQIGSLLAGAGFAADAAQFLRQSLATYGDDPVTLSNLTRCEEVLARTERLDTATIAVPPSNPARPLPTRPADGATPGARS